jgi:phosphopentomutase
MARAFLIVLDSVGCGGAQDAEAFGDAGADTTGHIAQACAEGRADRAGLRGGALRLPHLDALGLGHACLLSTGRVPPGLSASHPPRAIASCARETSRGKDTPAGHWEIAGAPFPGALHVFPDTRPAFPRDLVAALIREGGLPGVLGDCHAEGIGIIDEWGEAHLRTGAPIVYTSADSVLQIAAHEETFGLERLYSLCALARRLVDPLGVGRVIARPFVGTSRENFRRTAHRRDFPIPPPPGNLLDRAAEAGRAIVTLGKIGDIFAHRATGREIKGDNNDALVAALLATIRTLSDGGVAFANLVDFDTDFGHRRDVAGYAACLERFDAQVPVLEAALRPGDLAIITADHGNDPTAPGASHTRENVPVLCFGPEVAGRIVPIRGTFADIGQSVAAHLGLAPTVSGESFLAG